MQYRTAVVELPLLLQASSPILEPSFLSNPPQISLWSFDAAHQYYTKALLWRKSFRDTIALLRGSFYNQQSSLSLLDMILQSHRISRDMPNSRLV